MEIRIRNGFDAHAHFRDEKMLAQVLPHTTSWCHAAIVMPNLTPPVTTVTEALSYQARILARIPAGQTFTPLMTAYLTDTTDPEQIRKGYLGNRAEDRAWVATKFYPAHATTNSAAGVSDLAKVYPVLETMQEIRMPLLVHGEMLRHSDGKEVDVFDREFRFIEHVLTRLLKDFPKLPVVLEHVSTAYGAFFVRSQFDGGRPIAATITPHHLVWTRDDLFRGGLRPDRWCLPVVKTDRDREVLRRMATSDLPCFFMGTDTAPHAKEKKYCACAAGGIYCAPTALETYAQVFEEEGVFKKGPDGVAQFERFIALYGAAFYGLTPSEETVTLVKESWENPEWDGEIRRFRGGEKLPWRRVA